MLRSWLRHPVMCCHGHLLCLVQQLTVLYRHVLKAASWVVYRDQPEMLQLPKYATMEQATYTHWDSLVPGSTFDPLLTPTPSHVLSSPRTPPARP